MRSRRSIFPLLLVMLCGCATTYRPLPQPSPLATAGTHRVVTYDVDWIDASRDRHVPARIYAPADLDSPAPVIVFSHGLGNSMRGYAWLGEHWASHGFISVHPDHAGADEDVTRHGLIHQYLAGFNRRLRTDIPLDLRFVIDQVQHDAALPPALRGRIDRTRIGAAGHSLGAYAVLALGGLRVYGANFRDARVRAAVAMSMSENFPATAYPTIAIPMLHLTGTRDSSILYGTLPYKRRIPFEATPRDDQWLVTIDRANHSTFSDDESEANKGAHDAIRYSTTLFWNAFLRDDASARAALSDGTLARALDGVARVEGKAHEERGAVLRAPHAAFGHPLPGGDGPLVCASAQVRERRARGEEFVTDITLRRVPAAVPRGARRVMFQDRQGANHG